MATAIGELRSRETDAWLWLAPLPGAAAAALTTARRVGSSWARSAAISVVALLIAFLTLGVLGYAFLWSVLSTSDPYADAARDPWRWLLFVSAFAILGGGLAGLLFGGGQVKDKS